MSPALRPGVGLPLLLGACALVGLLTPACDRQAQPSGPTWLSLARGYQPTDLLARARGLQEADGLAPEDCNADELGVHVSHRLAADAWRASDGGRWVAEMPRGAFRHGAPGLASLQLGEKTLLESLVDHPADGFRIVDGRIECRLGEPGPPSGALLVQRLESGRSTMEGDWQVRNGTEYGSGFAVWSGSREEVALELPAASQLRFVARYRTREPAAAVTVTIHLDGEAVRELRLDSAAIAASGQWCRVELPSEARRSARLAFEVRGPAGHALILRPVVGPAAVGTPGERPWSARAPDIVLFLADTLRADALALGGGPADLAPNLNRFAERAVGFQNARSNASWTLPSISTLLTGLAPGQHTVNSTGRSLPHELVTVVESLARAGYRTAGVTDAVYFTPMHGLDQGFETLVTHNPADWDLDWSVDRALELLDQDDGRPLFLLVHTYRAHLPYRSGPDEDPLPWEELKRSGCRPLWMMAKLPPEEWHAKLDACRPRILELYRQGVRDLDRGFGLLLDGLAQRGLDRSAWILFTADHGESLGENNQIFHGGDLWDTRLRIPLLLAGPGLVPRIEDADVTLIDVAPTLAEVAGLERGPAWLGTSLLSEPGGRPAVALRWQQRKRQVAVVEGGKKLFTRDPAQLAEGRSEVAFDLASDPFEERALAGSDWPAELARRHARFVAAMLEPVVEPADAQLDPAKLRELEALGYGGDEDEE